MTTVDRLDGSAAPDDLSDMVHPVRPALDALALEQLQLLGDANGEDLVSELATMFLGEADDRILELRGALSDADADALYRSAHNLSGSSAYLGATDLALLCRTLATDSERGDLRRAQSLLEAVESELKRVRVAFSLRIPASP
jgi:HPt (histidine-containing phosphotransfer) domain-containing protein